MRDKQSFCFLDTKSTPNNIWIFPIEINWSDARKEAEINNNKKKSSDSISLCGGSFQFNWALQVHGFIQSLSIQSQVIKNYEKKSNRSITWLFKVSCFFFFFIVSFLFRWNRWEKKMKIHAVKNIQWWSHNIFFWFLGIDFVTIINMCDHELLTNTKQKLQLIDEKYFRV